MRHSKYNARKITIDGITFDSIKEAARYKELKLLERAGEIKDLELQPKFVLLDSFYYGGKKEREISYVADFKYYDKAKSKIIVEDVKGFKTDVYKIKRKLFLSMYCCGDTVFIES